MKIKVCGMKFSDNIREVAALHPDFMGFIFYKKSKRFVGDDFQMPSIDNNIIKVGVFVNELSDEIVRLTNKYSINHVQLHGDESVYQCAELKSKEYKIIKAFSITSNIEFEMLNSYSSVVDYFLFDTKGENYGGNGISFDWNLLLNYKNEIPFFLSGGLSLSNTELAMSSNHPKPFALDVNSGFETEPGLKNISDLKRLFELRQGLDTYV